MDGRAVTSVLQRAAAAGAAGPAAAGLNHPGPANGTPGVDSDESKSRLSRR
jgi:hypothetical protein